MAFTDIDKVNGRTIRKLHNNDKSKTFGFISGIKQKNGDLHDVLKHDNLTSARLACGWTPPAQKLTAPKSSYPQNQKGYDPSNGKSTKAA